MRCNYELDSGEFCSRISGDYDYCWQHREIIEKEELERKAAERELEWAKKILDEHNYIIGESNTRFKIVYNVPNYPGLGKTKHYFTDEERTELKRAIKIVNKSREE